MPVSLALSRDEIHVTVGLLMFLTEFWSDGPDGRVRTQECLKSCAAHTKAGIRLGRD
jgi:hypothetical protein